MPYLRYSSRIVSQISVVFSSDVSWTVKRCLLDITSLKGIVFTSIPPTPGTKFISFLHPRTTEFAKHYVHVLWCRGLLAGRSTVTHRLSHVHTKAREIITCEPAVSCEPAVKVLFFCSKFYFSVRSFIILLEVLFFCSKFYFSVRSFVSVSIFFLTLIYFSVPSFVSVFHVFVLCIALVGHRNLILNSNRKELKWKKLGMFCSSRKRYGHQSSSCTVA